MLYIGLLTTDQSGPAFECSAALRAADKIQLPILWGKLQCCLNFFLFLWKERRRAKASCFGFC